MTLLSAVTFKLTILLSFSFPEKPSFAVPPQLELLHWTHPSLPGLVRSSSEQNDWRALHRHHRRLGLVLHLLSACVLSETLQMHTEACQTGSFVA